LDASETTRWCRLLRAIHLCHRSIRGKLSVVIAQHNLNENQFLLLEVCDQLATAELDQRALSREIGQSPSLTSQVVESLRQRGLVQLDRSSHDRRRQIVDLSDQGRLLYTAVTQQTECLAEELFEDHSCDEVESLIKTLEHLAQRCDTPNSRGKVA